MAHDFKADDEIGAAVSAQHDDPYTLIGALNDGVYRAYQRDGYRIFLNVSESRQMAKRAVGKYEPWKFAALGAALKPGSTFLDIGANKGDFSLFAASRAGDTGCVLAVEPHPDNLGWFRRSIALNGFRTIQVCAGVISDTDGILRLHIGSKSGHHALAPQTRDRGTLDVESTTLDDLVSRESLQRLDAIKIDVEGAEDRVIAGAKATLARFRPLIFLDVHDLSPDQLSAMATPLRALGYQAETLGETPEPVALDALQPDQDYVLRASVV
ncbi:MAG: FkbM family methyltransferase [Pseudomonadota bacterium]